MLQSRSTDRLIFHGVKAFSDDSFTGLGMMVENPGYIDGREGLFINRGSALVELLAPYWKAGAQIHVHSNGNAGQDNTLDALAALQRQVPRFDHRFTAQHFGLVTPAQAKRLHALGGLASINPYYVYHWGEVNESYIGTDRAHLADRFRTLIDLGFTVSMHSDTPVGPAKPLEWVWIAVNRLGESGKVLAPDERVSVDEALRMVTIDAAYTLGVDDRLGSIEAGKFADFAVLEQDPREVAKEKIRDIPVWGTVVAGKIFPVSEIKPPSGERKP
jgi:predicted amidohydrolase YtcJ